MLVYDLKRAFRPQWLWVSVWIMLMIAAVSRLDTITEVVRGSETMEAGWTLNFIQETLTGEQIFFCLPVLCAFPYASSFIDEYQSGMVKFSLTRTKKRKLWLISKASVTALSGGGVLAAGVLAGNHRFMHDFYAAGNGGGTDGNSGRHFVDAMA